MGCDLAGSKGVGKGSAFVLTPAPVLAERVASGDCAGTASPSTLFQGFPAKEEFFFSFCYKTVSLFIVSL